MSLRHWVARGTGTPKDKDEVNRREVYECDGCDLFIMNQGQLEHLKIKTRLIDEMSASVMGEYVIVNIQICT